MNGGAAYSLESKVDPPLGGGARQRRPTWVLWGSVRPRCLPLKMDSLCCVDGGLQLRWCGMGGGGGVRGGAPIPDPGQTPTPPQAP